MHRGSTAIPEKSFGLRSPVTGEAKSPEDLWPPGEPVPEHLQKADQQKGITGENLLNLLERRLDNIVYRLGFANSRNEARQLVLHGHFAVNHSKVSIPSYLVKPGDVVELREKSKKVVRILEALEGVARREFLHGWRWIKIR